MTTTLETEDLYQVVMGPGLWEGFVRLLYSQGLEPVRVLATPWPMSAEAPPTYRIVPDPLKARPRCEWSGNQIKALRIVMGVSVPQLAAILNLSGRRVVDRWEDANSQAKPGEPRQMALDKLYGALSDDQMSDFGVIMMQLAAE